MKRILVLGYFGYLNNQIDGQTLKTRSIYDLLRLKSKNSHVIFFDTQKFQKNRFYLLNLIGLLLTIDTLIYLPGRRNLKYLSAVIFMCSKISKYKVIYPVVGGWISDFLVRKNKLRYILADFEVILVESFALKRKLETLHKLNNVVFFPNFRLHDFRLSTINTHNEIRLVFMARIMKEKGCDLIFDFAHFYKQNNFDKPIQISFYGPIAKEYEKEFNAKLAECDFAKYYGIANPREVYSILSKQDILLLPTFYEGEGFPGSILDAYIAGIPVIASKWKDIPEFIDEGLSGFTFELCHKTEFYDAINRMICDQNLLLKMKKYSRKKSEEYSSDSAWKILCQYL